MKGEMLNEKQSKIEYSNHILDMNTICIRFLV